MLFIVMLAAPYLYAGKNIVIDLSAQRAYAYEDDTLVFEGRISSGMKGRETPVGEYRILEKERMYISNRWPKPNGGAKMPYMLRMTYDGTAMHLGYVSNYPASHGCIRLKNGFAQRMYRWAETGTPVRIEGDTREYLKKHQKRASRYDIREDDYAIIDFHD